jgi:hypothetical protein
MIMTKGDARMQSGLKSVWAGLAVVCCLFLSTWQAAAQDTGPKDHGQIYKRAVAAIDAAEKKLAGNYTAEAKSLVKESSSLFGILQKEMPEKMKNMELTPAQDEQYTSNMKLGENSTAEGNKLERSAQEKQKKADTMDAQGSQDMAIKLNQEAMQELNLAEKAHLRAAIYHLRNLQLSYSFLNK